MSFDAKQGFGGPEYGTTPQVVTGSETTANILRQTRPWVRFIAVLGFITGGLSVVAGGFIIIASIVSRTPAVALVGLLYPALGLLYIVPSIFLNRYASRINDYIRQQDQQRLDIALSAQKSFWKFVGITVLVVMSLYAAMFVLFAMAAILSMI